MFYDSSTRRLHQRFLIRKAEQYLLSIPTFGPDSSSCEECPGTGLWRLTLSSLEELRSKIDAYDKERRERIQSWLVVVAGFVSAFTGLMGALIGLIAISN